jgi:hypothetical protein
VPVDPNTWFAAQDTAPECQALSNAFGLGGISLDYFAHACLEDAFGDHINNQLVGPLYCSTYAGCPNEHLNNMDQLGTACSQGSRRSICPCQ